MKALILAMMLAAAIAVPLRSQAAEVISLRPVQAVLTDNKEIMIKAPQGVACNEDALFVVADSGNARLLTYTYKDEIVKWGSEIKVPQISYPIRVQLNAKGEIYVLDGKTHRLVRLSPDGKFLGYVDPAGIPGPADTVLRSFKIDSQDNLYLLDILNDRVLVLGADGKFQRVLPLPGNRGFFSDIAVGANGDVYALDSTNVTVFAAHKDATAFTPLTANMREDMNYPTYLTTDKRGTIYVVDQNGGGIIALGQNGAFLTRMLGTGWKIGLLNHPGQLCLNGKGAFFVADRDNNRVQVFEMSR